MKTLALVISRVFDPFLEIPALLIMAVIYAYFNGMEWQFMTVLLIIDAVLPMLFFIHLLRKHEVHDWDITERKERYPLYGFTMAAHLAGVLLAFLLGQAQVAQILFVFWIIGIIFFAITLYWKISVHGGVNAALATFLVLIWGRQYAWFFLAVLVVGWSRVYLKKHTASQYFAGATLATVSLFVGFYILAL